MPKTPQEHSLYYYNPTNFYSRKNNASPLKMTLKNSMPLSKLGNYQIPIKKPQKNNYLGRPKKKQIPKKIIDPILPINLSSKKFMKAPQKTLKVNMHSMKMKDTNLHKRGYSTEQAHNPDSDLSIGNVNF